MVSGRRMEDHTLTAELARSFFDASTAGQGQCHRAAPGSVTEVLTPCLTITGHSWLRSCLRTQQRGLRTRTQGYLQRRGVRPRKAAFRPRKGSCLIKRRKLFSREFLHGLITDVCARGLTISRPRPLAEGILTAASV